MKLEKEDEEVFDLFVQWQYEGKQSLPELVRLEEDDTDLTLSVKLHVFASAGGVGDLQREVVDRLVEAIDRETNYVPSLTVVSYIYGLTMYDVRHSCIDSGLECMAQARLLVYVATGQLSFRSLQRTLCIRSTSSSVTGWKDAFANKYFHTQQTFAINEEGWSDQAGVGFEV